MRVDGAKLLKSRGRSTEMEIVLREGKNREIRRILARLGHKVQHFAELLSARYDWVTCRREPIGCSVVKKSKSSGWQPKRANMNRQETAVPITSTPASNQQEVAPQKTRTIRRHWENDRQTKNRRASRERNATSFRKERSVSAVHGRWGR